MLQEDKEAKMLANAPLFCLPKPRQAGQWQILSDMCQGGLNTAIALDPTVFPKMGIILNQLYKGGYSGVMDASKFFYQFKTALADQPNQWTIHP